MVGLLVATKMPNHAQECQWLIRKRTYDQRY
jgi:hypothetical protein